MNIVPYSLLIDFVVAALLVVTIGYAIRLNKRLSMLRRDKAELEKLASAFADSTVRANESLGSLRATADMMQSRIDSAQALHDDLNYLVDRGEKAADRLEASVRNSREFDRAPDQVTPASSDLNLSNAIESPTLNCDDTATMIKSSRDIEVKIDEEHLKETNVKSKDKKSGRAKDNNEPLATTDAERDLLKALRSVK